jgi:hypothetical protein
VGDDRSYKEMMMTTELAKRTTAPATLTLTSIEGFEALMRLARLLSASSHVPKRYQGEAGLADAVVALDMSVRMGAAPLMVMQHLYVVYGMPSWSAQFLIASVNSCGRFGSIRYEWRGDPSTPEFKDVPDNGCRAVTTEVASGEKLCGSWVTMRMVRAEGWWDRKSKDGGPASKWPTMTQQMFMYRAASLWARAYAPEIVMGFRTVEENEEISDAEYTVVEHKPAEPVSDNAEVEKPVDAVKEAASRAVKAKAKQHAAPATVTAPAPASSPEPKNAPAAPITAPSPVASNATEQAIKITEQGQVDIAESPLVVPAPAPAASPAAPAVSNELINGWKTAANAAIRMFGRAEVDRIHSALGLSPNMGNTKVWTVQAINRSKLAWELLKTREKLPVGEELEQLVQAVNDLAE